ncbi:glutarate dioxygenase GlaH [Escherichia coli]
MNALTAVQNNAVDSGQDYSGFTFIPSAQSPRLLELTFTEQTTKQFLEQVAEWPVQALEYKSFLRFRVGKILDDLCANQLQPLLLKTLLNRAEGALLINAVGIDDVAQADEMVKLATAVAHLIGRSNFDAMSGQYYARFVVKNIDNSDSYLRQPHRVMELHNDGTYVEEITDYVLMMKIDEQNMQGGNSLLLHLDDWEHLDHYFRHPLARRPMRFAAPPSKNVSKDVFHPVFDVDQQGRPVMRYIDQFVQPKDFEEGVWLSELSDAIETSKGILSVPVPVGKFLLINNLFWLHGREREPNITGLGGIFVPSSGIVSYREVTAAMAKIFQDRGGEIIYNAEVSALNEHKNGVVIRTSQGGEYEASTLISCSGLMADRLVKMLGLEPGFIICPFRGEYFRLAPEHNQIVNHLIYPIPDPAMPFLGVHLTRMIDGSVTVGPNAVLAFKREGYRKRDFSFSDTLEILGSSGIRRVLQNHLRSGLGEMKNSLCKSGYLRLVQKYCPRLSLSDLQPWPAGVRAQAVSPDGKLIDDFLFVTTPRTIHTCNAPSPAATSAIPIGAHIVSKVQTLLASQSNHGRTLRAARSVDALHAAFNQ